MNWVFIGLDVVLVGMFGFQIYSTISLQRKTERQWKAISIWGDTMVFSCRPHVASKPFRQLMGPVPFHVNDGKTILPCKDPMCRYL